MFCSLIVIVISILFFSGSDEMCFFFGLFWKWKICDRDLKFRFDFFAFLILLVQN